MSLVFKLNCSLLALGPLAILSQSKALKDELVSTKHFSVLLTYIITLFFKGIFITSLLGDDNSSLYIRSLIDTMDLVALASLLKSQNFRYFSFAQTKLFFLAFSWSALQVGLGIVPSIFLHFKENENFLIYLLQSFIAGVEPLEKLLIVVSLHFLKIQKWKAVFLIPFIAAKYLLFNWLADGAWAVKENFITMTAFSQTLIAKIAFIVAWGLFIAVKNRRSPLI